MNAPRIVEGLYGYHAIETDETGSAKITWHPRKVNGDELDRVLADVLAQPDVMALVQKKMSDRINQKNQGG